MYDLMTTVSVLVDDLDPAVDVLCNSLGVPRPRPQALREGPGIRAMFCRVHPKYPVAPTFLEIVSPGPVGDVGSAGGVFPVVEIATRQGSRPVKWHNRPSLCMRSRLHGLWEQRTWLRRPP